MTKINNNPQENLKEKNVIQDKSIQVDKKRSTIKSIFIMVFKLLFFPILILKFCTKTKYQKIVLAIFLILLFLFFLPYISMRYTKYKADNQQNILSVEKNNNLPDAKELSTVDEIKPNTDNEEYNKNKALPQDNTQKPILIQTEEIKNEHANQENQPVITTNTNADQLKNEVETELTQNKITSFNSKSIKLYTILSSVQNMFFQDIKTNTTQIDKINEAINILDAQDHFDKEFFAKLQSHRNIDYNKLKKMIDKDIITIKYNTYKSTPNYLYKFVNWIRFSVLFVKNNKKNMVIKKMSSNYHTVQFLKQVKYKIQNKDINHVMSLLEANKDILKNLNIDSINAMFDVYDVKKYNIKMISNGSHFK